MVRTGLSWIRDSVQARGTQTMAEWMLVWVDSQKSSHITEH